MFSGIVTAIGRITQLTPRPAGFRLTVEAGALDLSTVALGDSIAHNGVCLTVVEIEGNRYGVDVSPETLACTVGLGAPGPVNLEKALRLSDVIGGHVDLAILVSTSVVPQIQAGKLKALAVTTATRCQPWRAMACNWPAGPGAATTHATPTPRRCWRA